MGHSPEAGYNLDLTEEAHHSGWKHEARHVGWSMRPAEVRIPQLDMYVTDFSYGTGHDADIVALNDLTLRLRKNPSFYLKAMIEQA
jgi:hypothetical protein